VVESCGDRVDELKKRYNENDKLENSKADLTPFSQAGTIRRGLGEGVLL
jgi:hypothetical protein